MVTYHQGDLLQSNCTVICHQVNCKGKMASGIARQIRKTYPTVYYYFYQTYKNGNNKLGNIDTVNVIDKITKIPRTIINMYSQFEYYPRGIVHTDYKAFEICLKSIRKFCYSKKLFDIGFPAKIGCGLAGGDWEIIRPMIEKCFKDKCWKVEIWELK